MDYILTLNFLCPGGEKTSLSVEPVKQNITKDEITSLMDAIITNDIFFTKHGNLVKKAGATLTERKVTTYKFS